MLLALKHTVLFKLLSHADGLSQCLFWGLIALSIACWSVWFYKFFTVRRTIKHVQHILVALEHATTLEELVSFATTVHKTVPGRLITAGFGGLRRSSKLGLLHDEHELISSSLEHAVNTLVEEQESYLGLLRLGSETGPLIGLFGTVWGLIHAFNRISEKQTADIPTVAPGIAEALVITLIGLFVAIPALVMYSTLSHQLNILEKKLWALSDKVLTLFSVKVTQATNIAYETTAPQSEA